MRVKQILQFDAVNRPSSYEPTDPHLHVGNWRLTDITATAGGVVWLGLAGMSLRGGIGVSTVALFVCLAALVLVPLGLGLAATPRHSGGQSLLYTLAAVGQGPAALAVVAALAFPVGTIKSVVFSLPWLLVSGLLALFGLWRLLSRGLRPLPELAIDVALLYLPVGAVALLLHRADITFFFDPIIILLTAVHYHYAGFVLPLVAGMAGRVLIGDSSGFGTDLVGRSATVVTLVILVNLALIAVGITFSPLVEVVAVSLFTVAVAVFAVLLLRYVVPTLSRTPAALLAVASCSVFLTMALALAYGYSAFPATGQLITISEMIRWHGTLNAFGFALPALFAFRLES
jgi:hypothetical protein